MVWFRALVSNTLRLWCIMADWELTCVVKVLRVWADWGLWSGGKDFVSGEKL